MSLGLMHCPGGMTPTRGRRTNWNSRGAARGRLLSRPRWSGQISKEDAKELLIKRFGPICWGCGYEPRRPNGSLDGTLLEVDHIRARKAAEGVEGDDELYNLALLHRTCNGIKRNKLTLEELRRYNADNGLLYVKTIGELVDLFEATRYAAPGNQPPRRQTRPCKRCWRKRSDWAEVQAPQDLGTIVSANLRQEEKR